MSLASWVLKRQLMVARAALRSGAWTSRRRVSSREPLLEAGARQDTELVRHIQPTAVLGGVVELQPAIRRASTAGNVSYSDAGRWQVVQDHPHHLDLGVSFVHQPARLRAKSAWTPPPAASRPRAHRPGTGCAYPPCGTRSPAQGKSRPGRHRVSANNWVEVSSKQTSHRVRRTGPARPPWPRTPWGCTMPRLSVFLSRLHSLVGQGRPSQQAQGPVAVPLRRTGQRDQVGFAPLVHLGPAGLGTVPQHPLQPLLGEAPLDAEHLPTEAPRPPWGPSILHRS